ncbi:putative phospholipid metabolism enzyme regulator [Aspergillus saccharolyticus JOP 1030-1]|uniref:Phospholipid metabolism enzyme regulator n=1 Tax=Aspergillus saccharolyticus JOP 1030-1 TaxID=1450539 RepID=A0A318ZEV8_9EURO|nr:phospholipid metabolism enzyme regulator [Aspergillus saccharolyticus JOP 1030-1]PYH46076.1 phospholipid metabolism enzyme regulator [Aspergillus saccharolyticus JOP 1030-1]
MAAESERSPYPTGNAGGSRVAQTDGLTSTVAAPRRSASESDMMEVPRSTFRSQIQGPAVSQLPKFSHVVPGIAIPTSTAPSVISSRETSPVRSSRRPRNSPSTPRIASRSRKGSVDRSPNRSSSTTTAGSATVPSATAIQRALSKNIKPPILSPPPNADSSSDVPSPDKSTMPLWATSRRSEPETTPPNTSIKRSKPGSDEPAAKTDRSAPRAVNRGNHTPGSALETVQEMASDQSTPSTETILGLPLREDSQLQKIDEDATPKALRVQHIESGSDSGGNKSSEQVDGYRRHAPSGSRGSNNTIIPKRSTTSLSGGGGPRAKPTDGSVRNMIVETETVSSIPQVSLGVVPGDRGNTGRVDPGTLRMKPSTETIRPKKEKKRTRKPAALTTSTASSKADIFEAKVASAVDEADVSDSDETFVYESNPPDPYPIRQNRYHSRTPSATSMASQVDQLAGRSRAGIRDGNHSVTGKRSMKFTNNTFTGNSDDFGDDTARSHPRTDGSGTHTPRHHHIGRYGRNNNLYPSLFDSDSPFPQSQSSAKSPRHFVGNSYRQSRHPASRTNLNYRTISGSKKPHDLYGYDFDAEGADDERTPLVGSPRVTRSRQSGGRRPNSASLRQIEYMQQRHRGVLSRYGACLFVTVLLLFVIGGIISFVVATTKTLVDVQVLDIQNVLASEQEIMLDLNVQAINPNIFPVSIDEIDMNIFAKSRFVGTDKLWRDHDSDMGHEFPRVEQSRKRAEMARLARCAGLAGGGANDNATLVGGMVLARGGVDKGTDPMPTDPAGDPQTMLLGRVFHFDSPLLLEPSPWHYEASTSKGQIRLARPGNKTEEGGTERWERVLQHPFELIVRGVVKYQLPLTSRYYSASVSSSIKVIPDDDDDDDGSGDRNHGPDDNNTATISTRNYTRRDVRTVHDAESMTLDAVRKTIRMVKRAFAA